MSVTSKQNDVTRSQKDLAALQKKLAEESKKEASKVKDIDRVERSITKSTSTSLLRSKQQQITRYMDDLANIQVKKADLSKKIADKNVQLHKHQDALSKEQERQRKKLVDADKKREREQLDHHRKITQELRSQNTIKRSLTSSQQVLKKQEKYDAFISHATEDKEEFVRPLAWALEQAGFKIWYDEFALKIGDSLRRSIDRGLSQSKYGIVILSDAFFKKNWPQYELDGLIAREMAGEKVVLPIWHKVSKDEVISYSPTLADKVAINSSLSSIEEIVSQLSEVLLDA